MPSRPAARPASAARPCPRPAPLRLCALPGPARPLASPCPRALACAVRLWGVGGCRGGGGWWSGLVRIGSGCARDGQDGRGPGDDGGEAGVWGVEGPWSDSEAPVGGVRASVWAPGGGLSVRGSSPASGIGGSGGSVGPGRGEGSGPELPDGSGMGERCRTASGGAAASCGLSRGRVSTGEPGEGMEPRGTSRRARRAWRPGQIYREGHLIYLGAWCIYQAWAGYRGHAMTGERCIRPRPAPSQPASDVYQP